MMKKRYEKITFDDFDISDPELLYREHYHHSRIPLMVTITDAISSSLDLQRLLEAGMNLMRFTLTYQTENDRIKVLNNLRKAADQCCQKFHVNDWPVATCIELKTTMAKTGILEKVEQIKLQEGAHMILTRDMKHYNRCNAKTVFVDNLPDDIKVGDIICIGSDETEIACKEIIDTQTLRCVVTEGGILKSLLTVCVKGYKPSKPELAPSDYGRIQFAMDNEAVPILCHKTHKVDIIELTHAQGVQPARMIKELIGKKVKRPVILTGISGTQEELEYIDDILEESDAILLRREILPLHLETKLKHRFGNIQKWVAGKCQQAGKPLFLSGGVCFQGLQTGDCGIVELADVANGILDGCTGLVLTNCIEIELTLNVIYELRSLCEDVEPYTTTKSSFWNIIEQIPGPLNAAEAAAMSCALVANQALAKIIIVPTKTGRSVQALYRMRPCCLILAVCINPQVARRLHLYKSVIPILFTETGYIDDLDEVKIKFAIEVGLHMNWVTYGDTYVTLQKGSDFSSYCDTVRITTVKIEKKQLIKCPDDDKNEFSLLNFKRELKKSKLAMIS